MLVMVPPALFLESLLDMYPPLPENDPEAWAEEFDNKSNIEFSALFDENLQEPVKRTNFTA